MPGGRAEEQVHQMSVPRMLPSDVFNLLRAPVTAGPEASLRKAWLASQSRPCKDVVVLAMPLRRVPTTLEAFRHALAENNKGGDWIISNWYVVYVGAADGREWGWSNAPYDTKKRLPDTKPLYSTDVGGAHAGQTRFWSFKKVSNNMNKGPRVEAADGEDLSFVLPSGTCFTHFIREDSYGEKPLFCVSEGQHELEAYAPVLLQLSSTNHEQAAKGNGLKLRRVLSVSNNLLAVFLDKFYARKLDLDEAQHAATSCQALSSMVKPAAGCPLACKVDRNAFWFHDEAAQVVEILDSGVDPELCGKLLVPENMLLRALHSADIGRALRMLSVALGHGAVTCVIAASKDDAPGVCRVVHMHIDVAEALWLGTLQRARLGCGAELPATSQLTMCFGSAIAETSAGRGQHGSHLQWFAPHCKVPVATEDGRELHRHIVFEMSLLQKSVEGHREVAHKTFLMDMVAGTHYVVRMYHVENVRYEPEHGLLCEDPVLLLSWQLRPGLGADTGAAGLHCTRKRQFVHADEGDDDSPQPSGARNDAFQPVKKACVDEC
jgi:hypothetical protein